MSGCEEPSLINGFHFHQSLCVLAPISVGSCYVLPVSTGIDGSLRQIQNYLETVKGLEGYPTFAKNVDVPTCVTLFIFYIMQALMAYISAWNTVVLGPKLKLCTLLKPHLYNPAPVPLLVCVPDEALFDIQFNPVLLRHLSGYLTVSGLWYAYLGIIQFSPYL